MPIRLPLLQKFLRLEAASGIILFITAIIAMILANSPLALWHQYFIQQSLFLVNEVFMALFFLLVGLELKKNYVEGQFAHLSQILLPLVAATFGMIVPAFIYILFNFGDEVAVRGWATPVATDIAFALGVISLFGKRIPLMLKLFLLLLAIFDDIGAILIIVLFYSAGLALLPFLCALALILALFALHHYHVNLFTPYLLIGAFLWLALYYAGIHPTIAGVILAIFIPDGDDDSMLYELENRLHPWVAYLIMPLFALTNAGFSLNNIGITTLLDTVTLGIFFGLFIGKQVGVFLISWLMIKLNFAKLPKNSNIMHLYGIAILCGIGFTMSLFLGTLSFQNQNIYLAEVRLGVIMASLLSSLVGALVLYLASKKIRHS